MAKSRDSTAITQLLLNLPVSLLSHWWESKQIHHLLQRGGFPRLPYEIVVKTFRSRHFSSLCIEKNKYNNVNYFRFGPVLDGISDYKVQRDRRVPMPRMPTGYYLKTRVGSNDMSEAVCHMKRRGFCSIANSFEPITVESPPTSPNENTEEQTELSSSQETVDIFETPLRTGLKLVDIDEEAKFLHEQQHHSITCRHIMRIVKTEKRGFDLKQFWSCQFCHTQILQRSSRDSTITQKQPGPVPSELNRIMGVSMYASGITN